MWTIKDVLEINAEREPTMARRSSAKRKASGGANTEFKARLAKLKKQWNDSREESKKIGTFPGPDGTYVFKLAEAELREGTGKLGLHVFLNFDCQHEQYKGDVIAIRRTVEDEERLVWLQRDLRRLGCDVDEVDAAELETALAELVGAEPCVVAKVVTSGEWQNLQLQRLVDDDELEELIETLDEELPSDDDEEEDEDDEAEDDEDEDEEDEEEEDEPEPPKKKRGAKKPSHDFQVGVAVEGEFEDDWFPGVVKSATPAGGAKSILVEFEDGDTGNYGPKSKDLRLAESDDEDEDEDEEDADEIDLDEDDADEDEDEREIEKGNRLWWEGEDGGENVGTVTAVKGDVVSVKPDGKKKSIKLDTNETTVELLDDAD